VRNVHPAFHWGFYAGFLYSGLSLKVFGGKEPWTFRNSSDGDHTTTGVCVCVSGEVCVELCDGARRRARE